MEEVKHDLRIGNIVEGGKIFELRDKFVVLDSGINVRYEEVERIEINLEHLKKFGFERIESNNGWLEYEKDGIRFEWRSLRGGVVWVNHKLLPCRFLNNLQNIYHDFTTKDLI